MWEQPAGHVALTSRKVSRAEAGHFTEGLQGEIDNRLERTLQYLKQSNESSPQLAVGEGHCPLLPNVLCLLILLTS